MFEFLKHALGFCGDHWHPNIWHFILGGFGIIPAFKYGYVYGKGCMNSLKKRKEL